MSPAGGGADGRRARGEATRRRLVEATLRVVEEQGAAGVTHRAVAEAAGVSLASASYHFAGIDELLLRALTLGNEETAQVVAELGDDRSPAALAELLAGWAGGRRAWLIGQYELYLAALRRPELAPTARGWLDVLTAHFAPALEGPAREAFEALVEGVCLHALFKPAPPPADEIEAVLRAARAVAGPSPDGHPR